MNRTVLLVPGLLVAERAFAGAGGFCFPGAPWCGGELGLAWVGIVVGLQLGFLYVVQGGPGAFLARFAGHEENFAKAHFGVLQIGLPIALVLSFPALMGLVLIDKWWRPVGLLEIATVQGLYWLWLARWRASEADGLPPPSNAQDDNPLSQLHESQPAAPPNDGFIGIAAAQPERARSRVDAGVAAILPRAQIDGIPLFPGAARLQNRVEPSESFAASIPEGGSARPLHPERAYAGIAMSPPVQAPRHPGHPDNKAVLERLTSTYMWDDAGSGQAFKAARRLPADRLLTDDDRGRFGEPLLEAMCAIACHTVAIYRYGVDTTTFATILSSYSVKGFDEYSADVMQRLTYSVLYDRQRLFIDQTDIEIFGEELIECLYRMALLETAQAMASLPIVGAAHRPLGQPVLQ